MLRRVFRLRVLGSLAVLLAAGPVLAEPKVVTLGGADASADPVAQCEMLAASPDEGGRANGVADDDIFLGAALAACEAAVIAAPDSLEAETRLARVYMRLGRVADATPLLEHAVGSGQVYAAYLYSRLLSTPNANGVGGDSERALALLRQAADGGLPVAETELALRYEKGEGVEVDSAEARRLYGLAADAGDGAASYHLGTLFQNGLGVDQDFARALTLFGQAAAQGEPLGHYGVGRAYQFGQGVELDLVKAADAYQLGADQSEPQSQTALAFLYEQGQGVAQDYDKSFALLSAAAGKGYGFGQAALSLHYLFGQGTPIDNSRALSLAWAAQTQGVTYAEGILGYMYSEGLGADRDLSTALFHFQAGANGGDQYSADRVPVTESELTCADQAGSQYEPGGIGHGIDFDAIDADVAIAACDAALAVNGGSVGDRVWLARAYMRAGRHADAVPLLEAGLAINNRLARTLYADLLMDGLGVGADPARAVDLYRAAAAQDFAPAQLALGRLYAEGRGVAADPAMALEWYRKAEENGVDEATTRIAELSAPPDEAPAIDLEGFGREGPAY